MLVTHCFAIEQSDAQHLALEEVEGNGLLTHDGMRTCWITGQQDACGLRRADLKIWKLAFECLVVGFKTNLLNKF